jgi:hypothetical protein
MPVYRGMLRNERVEIWRRTVTEDGMCGVYPSFELHISCYLCRLYFNEEEKTRQDTGEERTGAWTMFGSPCADIREGDKVIRPATGQAFIITSLRKPLDGRVEHHCRAVMRKIEGGSSSN